MIFAAATDVAVAVLTLVIVAVVRVLWNLGSRVSRLEGVVSRLRDRERKE